MMEIKIVYLDENRKVTTEDKAKIEAIRILEDGKMIKESFGIIDNKNLL